MTKSLKELKGSGSLKELRLTEREKSSPAALEQILILIPKLSQPDLRAALTALDKELISRSDIDQELIRIMLEAADQKPMAIGVFAISANGTLWRKNIPAFHTLVDRLTDGRNIRQAGLHALHRDLFRLLVDYMKDNNIPLTLKMVCQELHKIQVIFDLSFPGYLSSDVGRNLYLKSLGAV